MRTITNPAESSARSSATMRTELQTLETEIANTSTGHDHDGSDSKALLPASLPSAIDAAKIADGSVSNAEFQYLNGVTSAIQTQFTGKETAGATAAHSALTTGVHGVGAGTVAKTSDIPVKATGAEVDTGTDDAKFMTAKAIEDSAYIKSTGNAATATTLATARLINGTSFNGSANIVNNFPEGFLINGLISVTDAAGITVAIKGMDGNDPSATNPVYCRINGVVRSITSALSVSKADGTNWCNAGSAELATKEIDYFVYLGYNATDGIVIGFSRIPSANSYDDFSTTTTNEKYCAISTITTAAATDYYNVIGRFAATLSAGAGYTWTVPTFTAKNLIQRPINETRLLMWQPAYSASGSMTFTSVATDLASYKLIGKVCFIQIRAGGTTGVSASNTLIATFPFIDGTGINIPSSAAVYDGGTYSGVATVGAGVNTCGFSKYDSSNFALAASKYIFANLFYTI